MDNCRVSKDELEHDIQQERLKDQREAIRVSRKDRRSKIREAASDLFEIEVENPDFWREIVGLDGFEPIYPDKKDMGMRRRELNAEFDANLRCVLNLSAQAGREEDWSLIGTIIGIKGRFADNEMDAELRERILAKDWLSVGQFVRGKINESKGCLVKLTERSCE